MRHQVWSPGADLHRLVPCFAFAVAVVAAFNGPASVGNFVLLGLPVVFFAIWAYVPGVPLWALSLAVLIPVVAAQRSGSFEPLLFDLSLLAFVVGRWAPSTAAAAALGLLTLSGPIVARVIQDPAEIGVGPWILGIIFPWLVGRAICSQAALAAQLDVTRRELAEQALYDERRRIARDVHDFVGHGLAAVMLQVTSARHVLRRDPAAAEEALLSAEEVGRRSMQELRRTVGLLRRDDEVTVAPPVPTAMEIPKLVEHARAGGLTVDLWTRGDLDRIGPSVGTALYRISQEALANAARHAPHARTVLGIEVANGEACLMADSSGPIVVDAPAEERPRYGLVGMQERASALGGELTAGPTPEGWSVRCRLPLERADAP